MKNFHSGLKEIYGPTTSSTSPLLSIDGTTLITDKEDTLKRWQCIKPPLSHNDKAINRLPQIPTNEALDTMPKKRGTSQSHQSAIQWQRTWLRQHSSRDLQK